MAPDDDHSGMLVRSFEQLAAQVIAIATDLHNAVLKFDTHIIECAGLQRTDAIERQQMAQRLIEIQNKQHQTEKDQQKQQRKAQKKIGKQARRLEEIEAARIRRERERDQRTIRYGSVALLALLSFLGTQIFLQVFHVAH
jgi:hypothetical protein